MKPKIYLPSDMDETQLPSVIAHEAAHLKRHDHWWKPLGFLLLAVYWFNPLCWLAYWLLCKDIELACDERVIKDMDIQNKKDYSNALLACSVSRRSIAVCPLAFGEVGVKERVKNVLNYKKPAFWIIIVAVIACAATAVCLMTNPVSTKIDGSLAVFLDTTIANHHQKSGITENPFTCVDYKILGTKKSGSEITLYMWVLYQEYSFDGELHRDSGSHTPTVVTVSKKAETDGLSYELVEYWEAGFGTQYSKDIKDKFPLHLQRKALDSQWCIAEQKANGLKSAQQYYGITTEPASDVSIPFTTVTQVAE